MHIAFVDSNEAALEAIARAKEAGHVVSFIESRDPYYRRTQENLRLIGLADWVARDVATTEPEAVTKVLAECHAWLPIDFAVSQSELSVEAVAAACAALGLRGTSPEAALTARRKDRVRETLRGAGLATPDFALAQDQDQALVIAERIGYPVVAKPPSGADSQLTFVAADAAELGQAYERTRAGFGSVPLVWRDQFARGLLIERHLPGPLISVEIGVRGPEIFIFCVSGRTRARDDEVIELGPHIPAELTGGQARACADYAASVCRAIGLDPGIFHLEMILTPYGPVLVEANPRIMGGIMPAVYRYATGHSIYDAFLRLISGESVPVPPVPPGLCVTGRRFFAASDGTIPPDVELSWLADQRRKDYADDPVIGFRGPDDLGLRPGQSVRRGQLVGRVIVRGTDYAATAFLIGEMTAGLERALGIKLMRGEHREDG